MNKIDKDEGSNKVCYVALFFSLILISIGVTWPDRFRDEMTALFSVLSRDYNWVYLCAVAAYVIFLLYLAFSKYGNIRLGPDDSEPEFSTYSWIAMLFSISLGVGLIFFGVQEPVYHYLHSPGITPGTPEASAWAMRIMFFHWGVHPWAVYGFTGLGLGYFCMRRGHPLLVSSLLEPILRGRKCKVVVEKIIDVWMVILTVVGMACSQITAGIHYAFGTPNTFTVYLMVNIFMSIVYISTAITGVDKGIKIVSDINLGVALLFMAAIFCLGPTTKILQILFSSISGYIQNFIGDTLHMEPFNAKFIEWHQWWTVFYWAWWSSWGVFCGIFIARISKGRTIKEFVLGAMFIPPIILFIWFSVFGGSGIDFVTQNPTHELVKIIVEDPASTMFEFLKLVPGTYVWYLVTIFLLFTFQITSANSGAYVLGTLSSNGSIYPTGRRMLMWSIVMSSTAAIIYRSGGIKGLQMAALCFAFPFLILAAVIIYSIMKELREYEAPKLKMKN